MTPSHRAVYRQTQVWLQSPQARFPLHHTVNPWVPSEAGTGCLGWSEELPVAGHGPVQAGWALQDGTR